MVVPFVLDGVKEKTSSKGSSYAEIYVRGVDENGDADFVQKRFMTFEEDVITKLRTKKPNDCVNLELEIKDATVVRVGL